MPKKIAFNVVYATGEDDKFRASELNEHGPAVRGWQSARESTFPQELILRLESPAVLGQVQILSHQYLIPERVELWLGPESHEQCEDVTGAGLQFDYLGYITLSDNRTTEFRSRELKSITVPPSNRTAYVKLVLHANHPNHHNPHNQVSLVAVQLLGEDSSGDSFGSSFDDLAFEMYVDRDVARIIRAMERNKANAVRVERFTYAGKLKAAMLTLREIGEKLGRLEVGKWQAIASEDYVRANRKKEQMEVLRKETYSALCVEDLLEENGPVARNDEGPDVTDSNTTLSEDILPTVICCRSPVAAEIPPAVEMNHIEPCHSQAPVYQSPISPLHYTNGSASAVNSSTSLETPTTKQQVVIATPIRTGSLRRRDKSATRNSYDAYDDRVIPQRTVQCTDPKEALTPHPSALKMNEREKKQAALPIAVFGITLVEKFYSRQYPDKEEGLRVLEALLKSNSSTEGPNKTARAAIFLLHRSLRDKVFSVYSLASSVVTYFFSHYITGKVSTAEMTRSVEKILPELLSKSGDSTPRIHNTAVHTVLSMAHSQELRKLHIIPQHLTRALTSTTHPRLALSKLEMVEQLILSLGISNDKQSGLTCRVLAELGSTGLHHPSEPVRKVAERVLLQVYRVNPRLVRKQLPPDDDITRRNLLYRHLMTEFDKIDLERRQEERGKLVRSGSVSGAQPIRPSLRASASSYAANTAPPSSPEPYATSESPSTPSTVQSSRQCIFCLQSSESFTEEGLNIHYWKYCPLLTRCIHCQEVVEVASLGSHLVADCDLRRVYTRCPICNDAIESDAADKHTAACSGSKRCPFCHEDVKNTESGWRDHLYQNEGQYCAMHPRAKYMQGPPSPREFSDGCLYN